MHRRSLERFPFDSILLPYNYVQMRTSVMPRTFERCHRRLRRARTSPCRRSRPSRSLRGTAASRRRRTWYEPLTEQDDIDLAVHWVLGRPGIFLNTVGDITLLPKALDAASRYESRPPDAAMNGLAERRGLVPLFS